MGLESGLIGKILSFTRAVRNGAKLSDIKVNIGGDDVLTAEYTQTSGCDSVPLVDDYVAMLRIPRSGRVVVVGSVEPDASQQAQPGENRLYARNSERSETVQLWLKADGTALLSNDLGSFTLRPDGSLRGANENGFYELQANGTLNVNGATVDPDGNITATSVTAPSMVVNNKELAEHTHDIKSGSSKPGPTKANN